MGARLRQLLWTGLALAPSDAIAAVAHSGEVRRDGFALSDVALFAMAVLGVWFARRSMRARAKARRKD